MKKSLVVFAILSTMILAACGGKGVQSEGTDSVSVDSVEVTVDSVAVEGEEVIGGGAGTLEVEAAQGEAIK